jgi:hypothetical protein
VADARREAYERLGRKYEVRVLEPSPPAVNEPPWLADDPPARGEVPSGRTLVGPTSAADVTWIALAADDPRLAAWCTERWLTTSRRLASPPASFEPTRQALHALAEHVLAAARHRSNGKIGLRFTRGGFGTPFFGDDEQVRIDGATIVYQQGHRETQSPIGSAESAAAFVGIECGAPSEVYRPTTSIDPSAPLVVDPASSRYLGDLYGFATHVLEELRARATDDDAPSRVQLWPEHFDVAVEFGDESRGRRAGYGLSPGDDDHGEPYLYVVPWGECPSDPWWNATYFTGARCDLSELIAAPDQREHALSFFEEGKRRLREAAPEAAPS